MLNYVLCFKERGKNRKNMAVRKKNTIFAYSKVKQSKINPTLVSLFSQSN